MIPFINTISFISFTFIIHSIDVAHCIEELTAFKISDSCTGKSNCNKEELEYLAISKLHDQIDDDKNGDIDITESKYFVKESFSNIHSNERAKKFHNYDSHIDKQDLWQIWKSNEVYNWTTAELINWLKLDVELPQYEDAFTILKLNGSSLSRLTDNDYLSNVLNIKNPIHRRKIMIKSVDVVLFGQQKRGYHLSIASIISIIFFFTSIIVYLVMQNIYSKRFVKTMGEKLNYLSETERNLSELRNKLKIVEDVQNQKDSEIERMKERHRNEINRAINSSRESLNEDSEKCKSQQEIFKLRSALHAAQIQINHLAKKSASLPSNTELSGDSHLLQSVLQLTHAIESQYLAEKLALIDHQSVEFMELNERMKKRKTAFLGTFRIIHSNDMDNIEKGFANTKKAYEKIIYEKKDKEYRWSQLENLLGLNLTMPVDIHILRQILHMEPVDLHKKDHSNSPLFVLNNEFCDFTLEPHGANGQEKLSKNLENSVPLSNDQSDKDSFRNSEESLQNKSHVSKSNVEFNEETVLIRRFRKDQLNKKRSLFHIGKTRIPSFTDDH